MEITGRKIVKFAKKVLPTAVVVKGTINYMSKNPYLFAKTLPTGERVYGLGMALGDAIVAGQNLAKAAAPVIKNIKAGIYTYGGLLAADSLFGLYNKARDKSKYYDKYASIVIDNALALPNAYLQHTFDPKYGTKLDIMMKEKINLPLARGVHRVGKYIGLGNITKNVLRQQQRELAIEKSSKRPKTKREIAKKIIKKIKK